MHSVCVIFCHICHFWPKTPLVFDTVLEIYRFCNLSQVWLHRYLVQLLSYSSFSPRLLFQVIRRGDRRPFYAPARYVMEVKTDQARLQVGWKN